MHSSFSDARSDAHGQWHIRPLCMADLDGLMLVQVACYGSEYMESREIYRSRLTCPMQCSLVAVQDDVVIAYLAAYRSILGSVTPLHGEFAIHTHPDTLYLHDMAVRPDLAGLGLASSLLEAAWRAQDWSPLYSALVSVQGSQNYWQRKGYAPQAQLTSPNAGNLRTYGDDAVYMVRPYEVARA